jgi:hypothetical protein
MVVYWLRKTISGEAIAGEQSSAIGESGNQFAAQYLTVRTSALRYGTSVQ